MVILYNVTIQFVGEWGACIDESGEDSIETVAIDEALGGIAPTFIKMDVDEIPKLLLEYNPNYKFYLRHHSLMNSEAILYAL